MMRPDVMKYAPGWWARPLDERLHLIDRAREEQNADAIEGLKRCLTDDTPYVFVRGGKRRVSEVRFAALEALQHVYHGFRFPLEVAPMLMVPAMDADAAVVRAGEALAALPPDVREAVVRNMNAWADVHAPLDDRAPPADPMTISAYRVLQWMGRIPYRTEAIDPATGLTPLQVEVYASQVAAARPSPHLEVSTPEGRRVGYVYREAGGRWTVDFDRSSAGSSAESMAIGYMTELGRDAVPRVKRDANGEIVRCAAGKLIFEGMIPLGGGDVLGVLQSLEALLGYRWRVVLRR